MRFPKHAGVLMLASVLSFTFAPTAFADEVPEWPSEQEQELKETDTSLLDVQRQRFRARLAGDDEEVKRLDRRFKELQKDRNQLLQATGRR